MKKRIALFLAIAMIVTLLAGCGGGTSSTPSSAPASGEGSGSSAQPVGTDKLVIWSYMNEGEPISTWEQSIVDAYSAEYPDVEVEIVFCGREIASQFQTKLNDKEADDSLTSLSRTLESWHLWRRRGCLNLWMKPSQHRLTTKTKHGEKLLYPI